MFEQKLFWCFSKNSSDFIRFGWISPEIHWISCGFHVKSKDLLQGIVTLCLDYFKVTLWDCCIVVNDAWPPLGVFGVMPNPQNVYTWCIALKNDRIFLHSIIWPLEIICNQFKAVKPFLVHRNWGFHGTLKQKYSFCDQKYAKTELVGGLDTHESF